MRKLGRETLASGQLCLGAVDGEKGEGWMQRGERACQILVQREWADGQIGQIHQEFKAKEGRTPCPAPMSCWSSAERQRPVTKVGACAREYAR